GQRVTQTVSLRNGGEAAGSSGNESLQTNSLLYAGVSRAIRPALMDQETVGRNPGSNLLFRKGTCALCAGLLFRGSADLVRTKVRSTKLPETARKRPVFRDASCDFVDRALATEPRKATMKPTQAT